MTWKILFALLTIPTLSYAQTWAPIGAKWTYTQQTADPNYTSYTTFESIADTVLSGQSCKTIKEIKRISPTTADTAAHYMYFMNDRVYFWNISSWCLLYDFNLQQGDSFSVGCSPLEVVIQSTDTININGHRRKTFVYQTNNLVVDFSYTTIESIGRILSMFPTYDNGDFPGPLRCYEDTIIGQYENQDYYGQAWTLPCDQILTGIAQLSDAPKFKAYPNPVTNSVMQVEFTSDDNQIEIVKPAW